MRELAAKPLLPDEHSLEPAFPDPLESIEEISIQEAQVEKHKK